MYKYDLVGINMTFTSWHINDLDLDNFSIYFNFMLIFMFIYVNITDIQMDISKASQ